MSSQPPLNPSQQAHPRRVRAATALLLVALGLHGAVAAAATAEGLPAAGRQGGSAWALQAATATVMKGDLSMDEAIDRAQKRYRARVVRAEQVEQGGRVVYVLRLLSDEDGRVFTVRVDARSGAMQ